jgi:hypothetical protein
MHIWTDTPIEEIWNQLRYLTSQANVLNLLTGNITSGRKTTWSLSPRLENQANEIVSCIRQADEYFQAARAVGLATKPLLLFYGGQALSKAAILANDSSISLADIKYHGLSTRPSTPSLQNYSSSPKIWQLEIEYATVNNGVFSELTRIANDTTPSQGSILYLRELFRIIPDIAVLYNRHYQESSNCYHLYDGPTIGDDGFFRIFFDSENDDEILKIFPEFLSGYKSEQKHGRAGFRSINPVLEEPVFGFVTEGTFAGNYYVRPHSSGIYKSPTVLYATMFILSNVVRYKPAFWLDNLAGKNSGTFSLAEAVTVLFARRFPKDILEHIWHEKFTFGTPGFW